MADHVPGHEAAAVTVVGDGKRSVGRKELIGLLAMVMAVTALSIDLMLPAFGEIRTEFGLSPDSTAVARLVTVYLLGLAVSQLPYGVLSDRFGRRPIIFAGLGIYMLAAIASALAPSFGWLLGARFLWGVGAAAPRVMTLSVVRDTHAGEQMAKLMSFIMTVFILVPVFAPSIGALMTAWVSWRGMFGFAAIVVLLVGLWALRLPETLRPENRLTLTWSDMARAGRLVLTTRSTIGYTISFTFLFGVFVSYLASSELIFSDVFGRRDQFPIIFGGLASVMGLGMFVNGTLVERLGLTRVIRVATAAYLMASAALLAIALLNAGTPGFWLFIFGLVLVLTCQALLMPNINSAAMVPMGAIAGTASAIIGTLSLAGGAAIGTVIDRSFDGTITPMSIGFVVCGLGAWVFTRVAMRGIGPSSTPVPAASTESRSDRAPRI